MTHPLSKRLLSLPEDVFHHGPPRPLEELEELERVVGERFPDDYRAPLVEVGPWSIRGPAIQLVIDLVEDVLLSLQDELLIEWLPGMVMIGNDGGDYGYYRDPKGHLGRGAFAVYFVELGTLRFEKSHFVAPTLTERGRSSARRRELSRPAAARQLIRRRTGSRCPPHRLAAFCALRSRK